MTNTRDLSSNSHVNKSGINNSRLQVQVDLNSTNSDSQSQRSSVTEMATNICGTNPNAGLATSGGVTNACTGPVATNAIGNLSVNSRPSSSVSPERRLDMVLGSESIQFIADGHQNPGHFKQMARPIPTFNSFGIVQAQHEVALQEVHRARPAFAPTPSPGGSESDNSNAPPLPARQQNNQNQNSILNHHIQQSSQQQQQPHSLPFFPFHQFPGRSVKPMRKSFNIFF